MFKNPLQDPAARTPCSRYKIAWTFSSSDNRIAYDSLCLFHDLFEFLRCKSRTCSADQRVPLTPSKEAPSNDRVVHIVRSHPGRNCFQVAFERCTLDVFRENHEMRFKWERRALLGLADLKLV